MKKVKDIVKGDLVKTSTGYARVACVLRTQVEAKIDMIHFPRGLVITPYHPVRVANEWCFPINIGRKVNQMVKEYFNFVLESSHTMIINGM